MTYKIKKSKQAELSNFEKDNIKIHILDIKHDLKLPESKLGSMFARTRYSNKKEMRQRLKFLEYKLKNN
jgi:hypothetical protein